MQSIENNHQIPGIIKDVLSSNNSPSTVVKIPLASNGKILTTRGTEGSDISITWRPNSPGSSEMNAAVDEMLVDDMSLSYKIPATQIEMVLKGNEACKISFWKVYIGKVRDFKSLTSIDSFFITANTRTQFH